MAESILGLAGDIDPSILAELEGGRKRGRPLGSVNKAPKESGGPISKTRLTEKQLTDKLAQTFAMIGMGVAVRNQADGQIIIAGAGELAAALVEQSKSVPWLAKLLQTMAAASSSARLVSATAAIVVPIGINHGRLPASMGAMFGMPPTEVPDTVPPEWESNGNVGP